MSILSVVFGSVFCEDLEHNVIDLIDWALPIESRLFLSSGRFCLILSRIIPQAVCVRFGLYVGATCAPLVLAMMYIFGSLRVFVTSTEIY